MKLAWFKKPFSNSISLNQSSRSNIASESGMTIIEILIVIALIGTIMTIIMTNVLDKNDQAKIDLTLVQEKKIAENLGLYKVHMGRYPTSEQGLKALIEAPEGNNKWRGPYTEAEKLSDPWSQDFQYEAQSAMVFKIISAGPDGEFGNADDISFPAAKAADDLPKSFELNVGKAEDRTQEEQEKIRSGEQ